MENHFTNLADKKATLIPGPATITEDLAKSLNLCTHEEFIPGSRFCDKPKRQKFAIISYIMSGGATPNSEGDYGFIKIRGAYETAEEAEKDAVEIVQTQDQLLKNIIVRVGYPTPMRKDTGLPYDCRTSVDVKSLNSAFRNLAKENKDNDEKARGEIEEKTKRLQEEAEGDSDPLTDYAMKRSKCAYWANLVVSMSKNIKEFEEKIVKTTLDIDILDVENPTFQHNFLKMIQEDEAKSGFKKGTSEDLDARVDERESNILHYKKLVPHLFQNY